MQDSFISVVYIQNKAGYDGHSSSVNSLLIIILVLFNKYKHKHHSNQKLILQLEELNSVGLLA